MSTLLLIHHGYLDTVFCRTKQVFSSSHPSHILIIFGVEKLAPKQLRQFNQHIKEHLNLVTELELFN
jgi:hypothetical protein